MEQIYCGTAKYTWRDKLRAKIGKHKSDARLFLLGIWWRLLWKTRLAVPYSRSMCKRGWYRKYHDGRCQYCGEYHKNVIR